LNIQDRNRLLKALRVSAREQKLLNWEGRIWIEEWGDTKWINIRATPRKLANDAIQWEGMMSNITQSKLEKFELEESRKRLADLSAHLERVKEEERARISREIHDDLGGNLTAVKIALSSIIKRLPTDQPLLMEKAMNLETIVDNTFEAAHRISGDLRPTVLSLGISAALEWQAKEFEKRMEIPCQFTTNMVESNETEEHATALFRICQEALSNIAKYAQANRVDIALFFGRNEIKMFITDDGVGIDTSDQFKPNSFGLRGMRERVSALGGNFSIEKTGIRGTNITVILPRLTELES
jgi:two-component system, NarL family, sensor histidine kinase UhpB